MLLQESEADKIAREQELDDRLPISSPAFIEPDRSALYAEHMRPQIARPEEEFAGTNSANRAVFWLDSGGACVTLREGRVLHAPRLRERQLVRQARPANAHFSFCRATSELRSRSSPIRGTERFP